MADGAHLKVNRQAWGRLVAGVTRKSTLRAAENLKGHLRSEIVSAGRVRTGDMAERWDTAQVPSRTRLGYRVAVSSPLKYTRYQNDGTRGSRPVRAKALRFSPNGGPVIFRMKTGPIAPARFMERAVGAMTLRDWMGF